jgi:proline dehydrogenase
MTSLAHVLDANPALQRRLFFLARRFVPGERIEDALGAVTRLNSLGMSASLDFLGEDVEREEEAAANTGVYRQMIERIAAGGHDANVSVKLTAIGQSMAEDLALSNLEAIVSAARPHRMFIRLDMEGSPTVDSTYRILDRVRAGYEHVGPVVQAYLHRAHYDVKRLVEQRVRVRLCKGAYKEPPQTAIQRMPFIRRNYMLLAEQLLSGSAYCGIATHDQALIEAVQAFVERRHIDRASFEFQMLYGIRTQAQQAIVRDGYRMRIYVPFGTHWAGYFYRRLAERKENVFFVLRNLFER